MLQPFDAGALFEVMEATELDLRAAGYKAVRSAIPQGWRAAWDLRPDVVDVPPGRP